jgi:hypothetical protein
MPTHKSTPSRFQPPPPKPQSATPLPSSYHGNSAPPPPTSSPPPQPSSHHGSIIQRVQLRVVGRGVTQHVQSISQAIRHLRTVVPQHQRNNNNDNDNDNTIRSSSSSSRPSLNVPDVVQHRTHSPHPSRRSNHTMQQRLAASTRTHGFKVSARTSSTLPSSELTSVPKSLSLSMSPSASPATPLPTESESDDASLACASAPPSSAI